MKTSQKISGGETPAPSGRPPLRRVAAGLAVFIGLTWGFAASRAQPPDADSPGVQVLTRGPVHEAFAEVVTFNPEPGIVVSQAPPAAIDELPPEEKPEGDSVTWIPGYWGWDDERRDFIWISGTWRALPPGRAWQAGYWGQTAQGYQWISGYWTDAAGQTTVYLPPPPATVEAGPNLAAPSPDLVWTPGCWIWWQGRYAWRPGYWTQGQADWDWIPAHYVWTPRGYIFVEGYWDYPVERRGLLFAPVYFDAGIYSRRGYFYSPVIVINLAAFSADLFLRPSYQHYYFGDYYAASYARSGFYASYSFQSGRAGYDPFYSRQRWAHRTDRAWEHRTQVSFEYRRDHEAARPPRTWAAQRSYVAGPSSAPSDRVVVASSIDQLVKRRDGPVRFQPVAPAERRQLAQRGPEVQRSREERRTREAAPANPPGPRPGGTVEPARVPLPRSPITARPGRQSGRNPAPPRAPQAPAPDLKVEPRFANPTRRVNGERTDAQSESRPRGPERTSAPGRNEPASRERPAPPAAAEPQRPAGQATARPPGDPSRNARGPERRAQPGPPQRARDAAAPAADEAPQKTSESEEDVKKEKPPRAEDGPDAGEKAPANPPRKNPDDERQGKSSSPGAPRRP
jgi:hypothetical protein